MFNGLISIDYVSTLAQASKLEGIAEECAQIITKLDKQLASIESSWEGEASEAFKAKLNEYRTQNIKLQNEMRQTASTIKQVAKMIKEADEAAAAASGGGGGGRF